MIKRFLPKSQFARNVITLMTGTALAQALPIAITPILTRMYTPDDFGVFAVYIAICSILAVLVTGRYELAIIVPEHDEDAINIMALSIGLSFIISFFLLIVVLLAGNEIAALLGSASIASWLYLVPLTTLVMGCYQSLNYWVNRRSHYKRMATSRVLQTASSSTVQLSTGVLKVGSLGLIFGQFFGQLISVIFLAKSIFSQEKEQVLKINKKKIYEVVSRYNNFPKYLIVAHGFNTGSSQSPVLLLSSLFATSVSGLYMLTNRVLSAPIALVASAIGEVFRQQASKEYAQTGQCKVIYLQTIKKLILLSFIPFTILFVFSEEIFSLVFGSEWTEAGVISKILMPVFFLRFISSPLSSMFMIAEAQKFDLYWQIALFSLVIVSFLIGNYFSNVYLALYLFSSSYCLMFLINLYVSYFLASGRVR